MKIVSYLHFYERTTEPQNGHRITEENNPKDALCLCVNSVTSMVEEGHSDSTEDCVLRTIVLQY